MTNDGSGNQNSLINILLVPLILALVAGSTSPWWFEPLKNTFISSENKNVLSKPTSSNKKTISSNSPTDLSEPLEETFTHDRSDISIEKLKVYSVEVNNQNEYSSNYDTAKIIDSNVESYWRTKRGSILDVVLEFYFEEPKSLSKFRIYAPKDGGSYTQLVEVELVFLRDSEEEITRQVIKLKGSLDQWREFELLETVENVSSVKLEVQELTNDTTRYVTINELEFYGY